jgi:hypothetical protein
VLSAIRPTNKCPTSCSFHPSLHLTCTLPPMPAVSSGSTLWNVHTNRFSAGKLHSVNSKNLPEWEPQINSRICSELVRNRWRTASVYSERWMEGSTRSSTPVLTCWEWKRTFRNFKPHVRFNFPWDESSVFSCGPRELLRHLADFWAIGLCMFLLISVSSCWFLSHRPL